jgi:hypothetical protein
MRWVSIIVLILSCAGCSSPDSGRIAALESRVAALEKQPSAAADRSSFAPGLGEIMGLNQIRHDKLWFAGANGNWPLAAYELDELQEGLDDAVKYHPTHDKVPEPLERLVPRYTSSPLQQLRAAIDAKDKAAFAKAFDALTAGCNECHKISNFGFNVVKRPTAPPFSNQDFVPKQ